MTCFSQLKVGHDLGGVFQPSQFYDSTAVFYDSVQA